MIMIMIMMREKETGEGEGKGRKTVGGNKGRPAPPMSVRHLRCVAPEPRVFSYANAVVGGKTVRESERERTRAREKWTECVRER